MSGNDPWSKLTRLPLPFFKGYLRTGDPNTAALECKRCHRTVPSTSGGIDNRNQFICHDCREQDGKIHDRLGFLPY